MILRPPRSTRTDTLFPYTTLFRSFHANTLEALSELLGAAGLKHPGELRPHHIVKRIANGEVRVLSALFPDLEKGELLEGKFRSTLFRTVWPMAQAESFRPLYSLSAALSGNTGPPFRQQRSEERRVGKEGVSTCSTRWAPD